MSESGLFHIPLERILEGSQLGEIPESHVLVPREPSAWKSEMRRRIIGDKESVVEELHGGHRNLVVRERGTDKVTIYWRNFEERWPIIFKGVLLEHAVSVHLDIPGRTLEDLNTPIKYSPEGYPITEMRYVYGETRYPWTDDEVASAAILLGKLHQALQHVTFDESDTGSHSGEQWIHLDYGRGNVLFDPGADTACAVIDFENAHFGTIEQELGRTLSLLLVDSKKKGSGSRTALEIPVSPSEAAPIFERRMRVLFDSYPNRFNMHEAMDWTRNFLLFDDYGDLSPVQEMAFYWMQDQLD